MSTPPRLLTDRRRLLARLALGAAAVPLLMRVEHAYADDLPHVSPADPAAKGLAYTENAAALDAKTEPVYQAGRQCGNCSLFQAAKISGGYAPCTLFPGKSVSKNGWCRAWAAKT